MLGAESQEALAPGERPLFSGVNRSELAHSKVLMLVSGSHQPVLSLSGDDLLL